MASASARAESFFKTFRFIISKYQPFCQLEIKNQELENFFRLRHSFRIELHGQFSFPRARGLETIGEINKKALSQIWDKDLKRPAVPPKLTQKRPLVSRTSIRAARITGAGPVRGY